MEICKKSEIEKMRFVAGAHFEEMEFHSVDFTTLDLKAVSFLHCKFTNCNLANQALLNSSICAVAFEECNLIGINWCSLKRMENLTFLQSKLNYSSFQGLKLKRIQIRNCSVVEADFSQADLSFGDFSNSSFAGTNFDGSNMSGADFRNSRDYVFDLRTAKIKGAKFSFPHVLSLVTALGAEVEM